MHRRWAEIEQVRRLLSRTQADHGEVLLIEGRWGMGQSEVAAAAAEHAIAIGLTTLQARGSSLERGFAFGVARQLFEPLMEEQSTAQQRRLFRGQAAPATPLLDASASSPDEALPTDAFVVAHGLYWLVRHLVEVNPVAVIVDEAHLADEPSILFLTHLVDRMEGHGCSLVLAAVRGHPGDDLPRHIHRQPRATILELAPLSRDEAITQLAAEVPWASAYVLDGAAQLGAGSPLLNARLAGALAELRGQPDDSVLEELCSVVDQGVAAVLAQQLDELGNEDAVSMAIAAAVLGDDAPLDVAADVAGIHRARAESAVRALVDLGLVTRADPIELLSPVVERALHSLIPTGQEPVLRERAAHALARVGRSASQVAGHLLRVRPQGKDWVVSQLWLAAEEARAAGSPARAAELLRRALAEPVPADVRPDLLRDLGECEALVGEAAALAHLDEAAALLRNRRDRASALLTAARLRADLGRTRAALATIERARDLHPDDAALVAALGAQAVAVAQIDGRHRESLGRRPAAAPCTTTVTGRALLAHTAMDHVIRGIELDSARSDSEALLPRLTVSGPAGEFEAVAATAGALLWLGLPAAAGPLVDGALAAARDAGDLRSAATLLGRRSMLRALRGELDGAIDDARSTLQLGPTRLELAVRAVLASSLLARGDATEGRAALPAAGDTSWHDSPMGVLVAVALGDLDMADNEIGLATARYEQAAEMAERVDVHNPLIAPHLERRALVHLRAGQQADARRFTDLALTAARETGITIAIGRALRIAARGACGAEAIRLLEASLEHLVHSPAKLELARAHLALGTGLLSHGSRDKAVIHLSEAERIGRQCGAAPLTRVARSRLRRAGGRLRRPRPDSGELTAAERRVAALARDGRTNREIAAELFVSVKAVEWHLSNTYRKLGISGRRDLDDAAVD